MLPPLNEHHVNLEKPIMKLTQLKNSKSHYDNYPYSLIKNHIMGFLKKAHWDRTVRKYKDYIRHKNENTKYDVLPEKELKVMGATREYIIDLLFNEYNKNKHNYYYAFGSNNILSDYDITIVGQDASTIAKNIYDTYFNEYHRSMATSFDTNIYCAGFYLWNEQLNSNIQDNIITFDDKKRNIKLFNFQPSNNFQKTISIVYAFIKLIDVEVPNDSFWKNIQIYAGDLRQFLGYDLSIENSYDKMFQSADLLYQKLYNSNEEDKNTIYNNVCKTQYYSIESYYTPCSVNVCVLELQGQKVLNGLDNFNHIVSIFENLGDLIGHWKHEQDFLKVSKYIYRIYYSFQKLQIIDKSEILKKVKLSVFNRGNPSNFEYTHFYEYIDHSSRYSRQSHSQNVLITKISNIIFNRLKNHVQNVFREEIISKIIPSFVPQVTEPNISRSDTITLSSLNPSKLRPHSELPPISTSKLAPISTSKLAPISTSKLAPISTSKLAPISTSKLAPMKNRYQNK
jgi:hypothetical protein